MLVNNKYNTQARGRSEESQGKCMECFSYVDVCILRGCLKYLGIRGRCDEITQNQSDPVTLWFFSVILEKQIRIPRSLSVKAASVLKSFLNKVGAACERSCAPSREKRREPAGGGSGTAELQSAMCAFQLEPQTRANPDRLSLANVSYLPAADIACEYEWSTRSLSPAAGSGVCNSL